MAAAICASGARSPEAPTEPWHGTTGITPLASMRLEQRDGRRPHARGALRRGSRASAPSSAARPAPASARRRPRHATARCCAAACARSAGVDAHAGELAEAGVDAVDRLALARRWRQRCARCGLDARPERRIERDGRAPVDRRARSSRLTLRRASSNGCGRSLIGPSTPGVQRVEAHAVDQLGRPLDVPDREVARLAGLERAGLAEPPERARRLARHAGEASPRPSAGTASRPCSWRAAARSAARCRDCSRSRAPSARRARGTARPAASASRA